MRTPSFLPLCSFLLLLFPSACSLDYEQSRLVEDLPDRVPDTILIEFTHTVVARDRVWVILEAKRAESYTERKEIALEGVHFREFDSEGKLTTEARADRALFNTSSEEASVAGSILIYSPQELASLQADQLTWSGEGRRLSASPEQSVRLQKDDGSFVEGQGFSADFRRRKVEFSSRVRGSYVWEEESEQ